MTAHHTPAGIGSTRRWCARALLALALAPPAAAQTTPFARLVHRLSEPGGFFDSDNLVSNESAYLHVLGGLEKAALRGGVYLGVGPEQNFSYIAALEPELALLVDVRRDNMLLHLFFKALFETSDNRIQYLAALLGRPAPRDHGAWRDRPLAELLFYLDTTALDTARHARTHQRLVQRISRDGIALSGADRITLRRFHDEFALAGLNLTFTSRGRIARRTYPTLRRLYLETDLDGRPGSYLATEERWQRVRRLQRSGRVVPIVGNVAGERALPAVARYLRETGRAVTAFYVSNVEMYLFRDGSFPAFAANVRALPARPGAVLVRAVFDRGRVAPGGGADHFSTQQLQTFERFLALSAAPDSVSYWALVADALAPAGTP